MTEPKVAILDGDILAYRAAFFVETEGIEYLEERLNFDIASWTPPGVEKIYIALSCSRSDNYRRDYWSQYKAHRDINKHTPEALPEAEQYVRTLGTPLSVPRLEADDLMGMMASSGKAIAVTIDKDLRSVPGWHWNPDKEEAPVLVDEALADRNFYTQWLTGDSTDNVPGIWKLGPKKAATLLDSTPPQNWPALVLATYEQKKDKDGNNYNLDYAISQAICVRILRDGEYNKENKTIRVYQPY
jgi:DNA polymerase-1